MRSRALALALVAATAVAGGCRPRLEPAPAAGPAVALVRLASPPALADDGDRAALAVAIERSLDYYHGQPDDRVLEFGDDRVTVAEMRAGLAGLLALVAADASLEHVLAEVERRFAFYRAPAEDGALFTGYYVPTIAARLAPDAEYRFPILGRPHDLVVVPRAGFPDATCREDVVGRVVDGRLVPYWTRAEIEAGAVPRAPVLAWARNAVDLFFLQIQGSGTLALPGDVRRTIGFAATNGRPYVSIGTLLIERGELEPHRASQGAIREWAAAHPDRVDEILHANPRFVFFRPLETLPEGNLGVPVTAGRSIATDQSLYPPGTLALIRLPAAGGAPGLTRLVLNQDTGGAIRGPGRVDLFFGAGDEAGTAAGRFKARGELYFLAPRAGAASAPATGTAPRAGAAVPAAPERKASAT